MVLPSRCRPNTTAHGNVNYNGEFNDADDTYGSGESDMRYESSYYNIEQPRKEKHPELALK